MAAPLFFVPLALAGGRVFFKFASKAAAEAFKKRIPAAGKVTKRTPPQSATVTTTGSKKGKDIVKDMTKPVTKPSIRPRNTNTTTLPKKPNKKSGAGTVAAGAVTAVGVGAGAKSAGESSPKKAAKKTAPARTPMKNVGGKGPSRTLADKIAMDDTKMKLKQDKRKKTWKDYSSIAAAKKDGSLYYSKNGKKMAAVFAEDLKGKSLQEYINKKTNKTARKKGKK